MSTNELVKFSKITAFKTNQRKFRERGACYSVSFRQSTEVLELSAAAVYCNENGTLFARTNTTNFSVPSAHAMMDLFYALENRTLIGLKIKSFKSQARDNILIWQVKLSVRARRFYFVTFSINISIFEKLSVSSDK